MKTIKDISVKNKTILVRVDYNVPLANGQVADDLRIRASLPTINYLLAHDAKKIILISHLGRPKGQNNPDFSLSGVAQTLHQLLPDQKINFQPLPNPHESVQIPSNAKITLLENLRFDPGEENNSVEFIQQIVNATQAELYVQDGFAVVHRAHASTDAIKNILPVYAGLLLEKEITNLKKVIKNPPSPSLLIIGGAKVEDKQPLIEKFLTQTDQIVVGGKIAADGYKSSHAKIYVAEDFNQDSSGRKLDIGPLATAKISDLIANANTIIWNGLLGYAEDPTYATASVIVAEAIGKRQDATTVICGGDTTGFVEHFVKTHPHLHYSLISTGGGAALEFLLGKTLPGLASIKN